MHYSCRKPWHSSSPIVNLIAGSVGGLIGAILGIVGAALALTVKAQDQWTPTNAQVTELSKLLYQQFI